MGSELAVALEQIVAELKQQLRDELLAELRADRVGDAWPRWMSVATVARYTDSSPERIRKLVARRQIPFSQEGIGCRLAFDRLAIDEWMSASARAPRGGDA